MGYQHRFIDGTLIELPVGKVVCAARNYAAHARELGNPAPDEPILFMKPATSLVPLEEPLRLPTYGGACHHELELAVLVGRPLTNGTAAEASAASLGFGLGLDLTLREVQKRLKAQGHPWEVAKAFDGACPMSPFVPATQLGNPDDLGLRLAINGQVCQQGRTSQMTTTVAELMAFASRFFTFLPGDILMTGTPPGVGPLHSGDRLEAELDGRFRFYTRIP